MSLKPEQERALQAAAGVPGPRPADAFWADFRTRAQAMSRAPNRPLRPVWPRMLAAAAGLALLLSGGALTYRFLSPQARPTIHAIRIHVPYESVMIQSDNRADLVWITGLKTVQPGGG
jgi:hypothetical protein